MTEKPRETQAESHVVELKEKVNNSSLMKHQKSILREHLRGLKKHIRWNIVVPEFLNWWPAVLGWPAVAASLMLAAAAIVSRHPALLVVSALLAAPFGLYLGGAENWMAVAGPAIPLALLAGAYALKRGWIFLAWCSLAPLAGTAGWLGVRIAGF